MTSNKYVTLLKAGLIGLLCGTLIACVGKAPGEDDNPGGPDAAPVDDPPVLTQLVSGAVMDYSSDELLTETRVSTDDVIPSVTATSGVNGEYELAIPEGSVFYAQAEVTTPNLDYRITRNANIEVLGAPVTANLYAVPSVFLTVQYNNVSDPAAPIQPEIGTTTVFINLRRNNGDPFVGVPAADISLYPVVGGVEQIDPVLLDGKLYFFADDGQLSPMVAILDNPRLPVTESVLEIGKAQARAALLNIPAGSYNLKVKYLAGGGQGGGEPEEREFIVPIVAAPDGVTLSRTGQGDDDALPPENQLLYFDTDVYPLLQSAAQGGYSCTLCHTLDGQAANNIQMDLPAEQVYQGMVVRPNVLLTPEQSPNAEILIGLPEQAMLITKPLVDPPGVLDTHPNRTCLTVNSMPCAVFKTWMEQGAMFSENAPVPPAP